MVRAFRFIAGRDISHSEYAEIMRELTAAFREQNYIRPGESFVSDDSTEGGWRIDGADMAIRHDLFRPELNSLGNAIYGTCTERIRVRQTNHLAIPWGTHGNANLHWAGNKRTWCYERVLLFTDILERHGFKCYNLAPRGNKTVYK